MGELHLPAMIRWLNGQDLGIVIWKTFVSDSASPSPVNRKVVIAVGIITYFGELRLCLIPKASTPLLLAKDDLAGLQVVMSFGTDRLKLKALGEQKLRLECITSGHYLFPLGGFPTDGHSTPSMDREECVSQMPWWRDPP